MGKSIHNFIEGPTLDSNDMTHEERMAIFGFDPGRIEADGRRLDVVDVDPETKTITVKDAKHFEKIETERTDLRIQRLEIANAILAEGLSDVITHPSLHHRKFLVRNIILEANNVLDGKPVKMANRAERRNR